MSGPDSLAVTAFWNWFIQHESALFAFESDQNRVFAKLTNAMKKVHDELTFEFGPVQAGRREFVISAGGIKDAFPAVWTLADGAPSLPRWIVMRFRPRRGIGDIRMGPVTIQGATVRIIPEVLDGKVGLEVLVPGYRPTPDSVYEQLAFLLLDQALGEFDVETKIGYIEVMPLPSTAPDNSIMLAELPAFVDRVAVT